MPRDYNNDDIFLDHPHDILGSEDVPDEHSNDPLDLADTVARMNPYADQLQHYSMLQKAKQAALAQQAAPANTNPPTFATTGMVGNQATFSLGDTQQLVQYQGDDAHASPITITLGIAAPVPAFSTAPAGNFPLFRPYAMIQFGTKGFLATAYVDIGNGQQFTISGSAVTVTATLPNTIAYEGPPFAFPAQIQLAATLSPQTIMRTVPLTFTHYIDALIPGTLTPLSPQTLGYVPPFARRCTFAPRGVLATGPLATGVEVIFYDSSFSNVGAYYIPAGDFYLAQPFVLPGDAFAYQVQDPTPSSTDRPPGALIFELSL